MVQKTQQRGTPARSDPAAGRRTPASPSEPAAGRREHAKDARRSAIVQAARRLMQATGEDGFSMQALADAADVSPMTPYNLFGSKQAVMLAVLDDDLARFEARLARVRADELETIFKAVTLARKLYAAEPDFYRAVFRGALPGTAGTADRNRFRAPRRAVWTRLLQRAVEAGHIRGEPDAVIVGPSLSQIVQACVLDWLSGVLTLAQFEARAHTGIALLLLGIAAPAARPRLLDRIATSRRTLQRARGVGGTDVPGGAPILSTPPR